MSGPNRCRGGGPCSSLCATANRGAVAAARRGHPRRRSGENETAKRQSLRTNTSGSGSRDSTTAAARKMRRPLATVGRPRSRHEGVSAGTPSMQHRSGIRPISIHLSQSTLSGFLKHAERSRLTGSADGPETHALRPTRNTVEPAVFPAQHGVSSQRAEVEVGIGSWTPESRIPVGFTRSCSLTKSAFVVQRFSTCAARRTP